MVFVVTASWCKQESGKRKNSQDSSTLKVTLHLVLNAKIRVGL